MTYAEMIAAAPVNAIDAWRTLAVPSALDINDSDANRVFNRMSNRECAVACSLIYEESLNAALMG